MFEVMLVLVGVLLAVTVGASIEYYRRLQNARREYEKARETVEDIVLSFNRQLKREAERLELVAYKVEAASSKSDNALKKAEEGARKMPDLESKISATISNRERDSARLEDVDKKIKSTIASQETLVTKVSVLEEKLGQFQMFPEAKLEAVIPIKREKALAPLTETELSVLEFLSMEGPKTAPEIKSKITLSREHTARLMKKLYEEGYLERDSNKIPFKYSVKKEMEALLKKTETKTA